MKRRLNTHTHALKKLKLLCNRPQAFSFWQTHVWPLSTGTLACHYFSFHNLPILSVFKKHFGVSLLFAKVFWFLFSWVRSWGLIRIAQWRKHTAGVYGKIVALENELKNANDVKFDFPKLLVLMKRSIQLETACLDQIAPSCGCLLYTAKKDIDLCLKDSFLKIRYCILFHYSSRLSFV